MTFNYLIYISFSSLEYERCNSAMEINLHSFEAFNRIDGITCVSLNTGAVGVGFKHKKTIKETTVSVIVSKA